VNAAVRILKRDEELHACRVSAERDADLSGAVSAMIGPGIVRTELNTTAPAVRNVWGPRFG
jgi:hypothetical protein